MVFINLNVIYNDFSLQIRVDPLVLISKNEFWISFFRYGNNYDFILDPDIFNLDKDKFDIVCKFIANLGNHDITENNYYKLEILSYCETYVHLCKMYGGIDELEKLHHDLVIVTKSPYFLCRSNKIDRGNIDGSLLIEYREIEKDIKEFITSYKENKYDVKQYLNVYNIYNSGEFNQFFDKISIYNKQYRYWKYNLLFSLKRTPDGFNEDGIPSYLFSYIENSFRLLCLCSLSEIDCMLKRNRMKSFLYDLKSLKLIYEDNLSYMDKHNIRCCLLYLIGMNRKIDKHICEILGLDYSMGYSIKDKSNINDFEIMKLDNLNSFQQEILLKKITDILKFPIRDSCGISKKLYNRKILKSMKYFNCTSRWFENLGVCSFRRPHNVLFSKIDIDQIKTGEITSMLIINEFLNKDMEIPRRITFINLIRENDKDNTVDIIKRSVLRSPGFDNDTIDINIYQDDNKLYRIKIDVVTSIYIEHYTVIGLDQTKIPRLDKNRKLIFDRL